MNFGDFLALVSKTTRKEACSDGEVDENKEVILMNFDDEVVAYYSNNRVKKFQQKPIGGNFNNSSFKKSFSNSGVTQNSVEKVEEKKEEKKFI